jgi:hypothetical protein
MTLDRFCGLGRGDYAKRRLGVCKDIISEEDKAGAVIEM